MGTVGFGSGLQGWAFTIRDFAKKYAEKFKTELEKLVRKFWGENYYSSKQKKWSKEAKEGFERTFNLFILHPIYTVSFVCLLVHLNKLFYLVPKFSVA